MRGREDKLKNAKGNSKHFYKFSKRIGESHAGSVECIDSLGVHKHGAFIFGKTMLNVTDKLKIRYIFSGRKASDRSHKPFEAHEGFVCCNSIEFSGVEHRIRNFKISKARVIHKNKCGLVFSKLFHAYLIMREVRGNKRGLGNNFGKSLPENISLLGLVMLGWFYSHYFVIAFSECFNFHGLYLSRCKNRSHQNWFTILFLLLQCFFNILFKFI